MIVAYVVAARSLKRTSAAEDTSTEKVEVPSGVGQGIETPLVAGASRVANDSQLDGFSAVTIMGVFTGDAVRTVRPLSWTYPAATGTGAGAVIIVVVVAVDVGCETAGVGNGDEDDGTLEVEEIVIVPEVVVVVAVVVESVNGKSCASATAPANATAATMAAVPAIAAYRIFFMFF